MSLSKLRGKHQAYDWTHSVLLVSSQDTYISQNAKKYKDPGKNLHLFLSIGLHPQHLT